MGASSSIASVQAWRCRICGEATFALVRPSDCTFCGCPGARRILPINELRKLVNRPMPADCDADDVLRLQESLRIELRDVARYQTLAEVFSRPSEAWIREAFARLSKIEAKHAEIFAKLLGPAAAAAVTVMDGDAPNASADADKHTPSIRLGAARVDELVTAESYIKYATATRRHHLKSVWCAVAEAERGHHDLLIALESMRVVVLTRSSR